LADTKKKILAILNQEKKKVDPKAAAEWLYEKIELKEINILPKRTHKVMSVETKEKKVVKQVEKLPCLIGSST
jgi:hypothetical protein